MFAFSTSRKYVDVRSIHEMDDQINKTIINVLEFCQFWLKYLRDKCA